MLTLSCEISKVSVTVILDSDANCNIIGKEVVNGLGLKIDDSSDIEVYNPISKLNVIEVIREIEISIPSQDSKWKQIKVTDIFVVNSPEHALSVDEYVKTIKVCEQENPSSAQANLSIKEKLLKNIFIAGLNLKNQLMTEEYGIEGLVKLLTINEIHAKCDPPPPYHP
ncbi:hypothetical protein Glove_158g15 [Diversispora epigaea]|uniref:Aspartic peptidase DDI1-type domain-containing protein n=1 Tax=Diversispora epigaea TaxID=1348612 RepID=A0A397J0M5_9GLOM|nr:hypothetical protein Glove_158g15 [Diversispora epigaea]